MPGQRRRQMHEPRHPSPRCLRHPERLIQHRITQILPRIVGRHRWQPERTQPRHDRRHRQTRSTPFRSCLVEHRQDRHQPCPVRRPQAHIHPAPLDHKPMRPVRHPEMHHYIGLGSQECRPRPNRPAHPLGRQDRRRNHSLRKPPPRRPRQSRHEQPGRIRRHPRKRPKPRQ